MNHHELRERFLKFFEERGHVIKKSASLIPLGDESLLFNSAGMVPFKDIFLGKVKADFKRAVSVQKCVRTTDIENIGITSRHLTFFEMMGNFSFGDYFKEDTIKWAWEFLVDELKLDKDKLYITVFKDDRESYDIWKKIVEEKSIYKLGEDTNFWLIGDEGPCGPCSEILFDKGKESGCRKPDCGPGCDCDRYLEVWNLVFTEFNRSKDGVLSALPRKNIDTGMGFERLLSVVQDVPSPYETDLFIPVIDYIKGLAASNKFSEKSLRIIADHIRTIIFLICDGVSPANEGRGYVIKRLIRRAIREGNKLGLTSFVHKIAAKVIDIMKDSYPNLMDKKDYCIEIMAREEERFKETLANGEKIFRELKKRYEKDKMIPGHEVFKLFDTYGIPFDLIKELAGNFKIDEKGYKKAMQEQKERAKKNIEGWDAGSDIYSDILDKYGKTDFVGYNKNSVSTNIVALIKLGKEELVDSVSNKSGEIGIVLKESPFYGESGGQQGDHGKIIIQDKKGDISAEIDVETTKKFLQDIIVSQGQVAKGIFNINDKVVANICEIGRVAIKKNHTATHILQAVLRSYMGSHIEQSGSDVDSDGFRFDFTHPQALSAKDIEAIEFRVNEIIQANYLVNVKEMDANQAKKSGALAFFGDKYGDKVRVVQILRDQAKEEAISREFCGGTHVNMTGEIGYFKILSEAGIASGIRRIEGVTGLSAVKFAKDEIDILKNLCNKLKILPVEISGYIDKQASKLKSLDKEIAQLKTKLIKSDIGSIINSANNINDINFLVHFCGAMQMDEMRSLSDMLKSKLDKSIIFLLAKNKDSYQAICSVSKNLDKYDARDIMKNITDNLGGGGGGRGDMSQAGIKTEANAEQILKFTESTIKKIIK